MNRRVAAFVSFVVLGSLMIPAQNAVAAPAIALLNPSDYSLEISDAADADNAYHFVAWVKEIPTSPLVEFELVPAAGNAVTIDANRVGATDVWEALYTIPANLTDGSYTVVARLYSGQSEVANAEKVVTLERQDLPPPPAAPTLEITHPSNGGQLGFFSQTGNNATAIVDLRGSEGAPSARVLVTTSAPGSNPSWSECGTGRFDANRNASVRCTLPNNVAANQVTAIAAVANDTPSPGTPSAPLDGSGDAHRVTTASSVPSRIALTPESQRVDPQTCKTVTARVTDQSGRPVAAVNVDVHAEAPGDNLRFGTVANVTSGFQAPDKGHVSSENAVDCADGTNENRQGDHNVIGGADRKHIESTSGTNNNGEFVFALRSDVVGGTFIEAWADMNNDDLQSSNEVFGGARIGWGQEAPTPQLTATIDPATSSSVRAQCQRLVAVFREGGNPVSNANVDVHATGPDAGVSFCAPSDGSAVLAPDSGGHVNGGHEDGTKHVEGQTDQSGRLIFGVVSPTEGTTGVVAWLDVTNDDILSGETQASASITWTPPGERQISIDRNKSSVPKGRKVRIFGQITGDDMCEAGQTVKLKSRRPGRRFRNLGTATTSDDGSYSFRVTVRRTKEYRTVAPEAGPCAKALSDVVRVRAT